MPREGYKSEFFRGRLHTLRRKRMAAVIDVPTYEEALAMLLNGEGQGPLTDAIAGAVEDKRLDFSPMDLDTLLFQERKRLCIAAHGAAYADLIPTMVVPADRRAELAAQATDLTARERARCERLARRIANPATGAYARLAGIDSDSAAPPAAGAAGGARRRLSFSAA